MTYPKLLAVVTVLLFSIIGILALLKGAKNAPAKESVIQSYSNVVPIELGMEVREVASPKPVALKAVEPPVVQKLQVIDKPLVTQKPLVVEKPPIVEKPIVEKPVVEKPVVEKSIFQRVIPDPIIEHAEKPAIKAPIVNPPEVNRVAMLFNKGDMKFPFVETVIYKSRVPWQKGRPAWLSDYASYYSTSRHFIARSLNGNKDYLKQDLAEGDRFNVFRKDKSISFHLLVDLGRCKLWLYGLDSDKQERYLIKTYPVSVGRKDENRTSGLLTPLGTYSLGDKVAIYKPKMQDFHNGKKVEMLRIFGTRWIPFDKEIKGCTEPSKALGIHGVPWQMSAKGELAEDRESLGKYDSDGCIRLSTEDIEEVFAIIITKPAIIELVADFYDAQMAGTIVD